MYVQGVSTRKVKAITEELCGYSFSASSISAINRRLDDSLAQFTDAAPPPAGGIDPRTARAETRPPATIKRRRGEPVPRF
jgi:hypothetical protein